MKKPKDEIAQLVRQGRMRNVLLTAKTMQAEVRAAAARVVRLSQPGTPARLFTLMAVAQETGLSSTMIVDAILDAKVGAPRAPSVTQEDTKDTEDTEETLARGGKRDSSQTSSPPHRKDG